MKKALFGMVLLASATLFAQSPFDGIWMTKLDTAKLPTKPDKYSLRDNMYECLTCVPKVAVKADGTDQKVTGHPYYDTVAVHVENASSVEIIEKKDGKVMYTDDKTISADGNTLNHKFTDKTGTQPVTGESTSRRVSAGPAGSHALSGAWRTEKINVPVRLALVDLRPPTRLRCPTTDRSSAGAAKKTRRATSEGQVHRRNFLSVRRI